MKAFEATELRFRWIITFSFIPHPSVTQFQVCTCYVNGRKCEWNPKNVGTNVSGIGLSSGGGGGVRRNIEIKISDNHGTTTTNIEKNILDLSEVFSFDHAWRITYIMDGEKLQLLDLTFSNRCYLKMSVVIVYQQDVAKRNDSSKMDSNHGINPGQNTRTLIESISRNLHSFEII